MKKNKETEKIGRAGTLKKILFWDILAFGGLVIIIWLNELFDLPHRYLGAVSTPINWRESLCETLAILLVACFTILRSSRLLRRMRHMEGILPVCASCKRIRDGKGSWHQIESYIQDASEAQFSHGICPDCAERLYPELVKQRDAGEDSGRV